MYKSILWQKILGFNKHIPWPVSPFISINNPSNIQFDIDDINNIQVSGANFQDEIGRIIIGKGTWIGPNVGLITDSFDPSISQDVSAPHDIIIGNDCWIGMNAIILAGVQLGDRTTVGAGSIVTKSFETGHCVIAGNPAEIIRNL